MKSKRRLLFESALKRISLLAFLVVISSPAARADVALLLEEPFGGFGAMNPTGHAALYFTRICAGSPTELRRCGPNEMGVVISRYHRIAGYDWIAMPLVAYLYAVDNPAQIPVEADAALEATLRDNYRRAHLLELAPDDKKGRTPGGEWIQLVGASYDRKIYGFEIETAPEQDDALIAMLNERHNRSHFNLLFRNCADFARAILNFYYPKSVGRNYIADTGIMTPKQAAKSLVKYSRRHGDLQFTSFVIPQVPGSIHRSDSTDGVVESLVKSKKYVIPLVAWHPYVAGTLLAAYISDGRFNPSKHATVFDLARMTEQESSGTPAGADSSRRKLTPPAEKQSRQAPVATE
jgi:hypothetical protein